MIGLGLIAAFGVAIGSLVGTSNSKSNVSGALFVFVPALVLSCLYLFRGALAGKLSVTDSELIYVSIFRSRSILKSEIQSVESGIRYRSARRWEQLVVRLRDGSERWITEFSVAPNAYFNEIKIVEMSSAANTARFGSIEDVRNEINGWIENNGERSSEGPAADPAQIVWSSRHRGLIVLLYAQAGVIGLFLADAIYRRHHHSLAIELGAAWFAIDVAVVTAAILRTSHGSKTRSGAATPDNSITVVTYDTSEWSNAQRSQLSLTLARAHIPYEWVGTDLQVDQRFEADVDAAM